MMENKIEKMETGSDFLKKEYSLLKKKETRRKRERFLYWLAIIALVVAILIQKNCSGKKDNQNAKLTTQLDSLQNENNLLKKENADLINRKPVLSSIKYANGDQLISSIFGDLNDSRPSSMFVKAKYYPVKISVPFPVFTTYECPDLEYTGLDSCVMDTAFIKVTENSPDSSRQLSNEIRTFPVYIYGSLLKNDARLDCNNQKIKPYSFTYSYNKITVDKSLIKSAKIKHWTAVGFRTLAMIGYNRLYHSNQQYAVTVNGVGPYEDSNPYKEENLNDRKIAKQKVWAERGIWLTYLLSEGVDYSSQCDMQNAYSSEMMNVSCVINF